MSCLQLTFHEFLCHLCFCNSRLSIHTVVIQGLSFVQKVSRKYFGLWQYANNKDFEERIPCQRVSREFKKATTATATVTSPNKRFN